MRSADLLVAAIACCAPLIVSAADVRASRLDDLNALAEINELVASPSGHTVLYTVTRPSVALDVKQRELWSASDRQAPRVLLSAEQPYSQARLWPGTEGFTVLSNGQVWGSRDGEPLRPLTRLEGKISSYEWSPQGDRLLVLYRADVAEGADRPTPRVINRLEFKQDGQGYLTEPAPRLYRLNADGSDLKLLAGDGQSPPQSAQWSPDGRAIAFIASAEPGLNARQSETLYTVDAAAGSVKALAPARSYGRSLAWAPDSQAIAFLTTDERSLDFRGHPYLALINTDGSARRSLTGSLDLGVFSPVFAPDGQHVRFIVTGDRRQGVAEVDLAGKHLRYLVDGELTTTEFASVGQGLAFIASGDTRPPELYRAESSVNRLPAKSISALHDEINAKVRWLSSRDLSFRSTEGVDVHALLTLPGQGDARGLPLVLSIHGGPNGQDSHAFAFDRQMFAAEGFAVLNVNYRGSSGRGADFSSALLGHWGDRPVADLISGVDEVVRQGIADPNRLLVGGWSFGGILTDYLIATDTRFKAAVSGAGSGNRISQYGHDQWLSFWRAEFPDPWKDPCAWLDLSYPFFHADRIKTPTLFLGGDQDASVPVSGSEQMYQALRVNNVPSTLVVYPGEGHLLRRPSFIRDRLERTINWYRQWLRS